MGVTLRVKNIEKVTEAMALGSARPVVRMDLILSGPAAAYALVWEWGRADCNPGPKTMWGQNSDGETRVLTKTAPSGYIRVNRAKYREFVRDELGKIRWGKIKPKQWNSEVEKALGRAAERCADLIAETAPYDKGDLRAAIRAVTVGEATDTVRQRVGFGR